jgi:hypothetical protein
MRCNCPAINPLWPGQKLKSKSEGEARWGRHTGTWRTESHTLESLCRRVTGDGYAFCAVLKQPWRKSSNFESIWVLATDNDGASLETLAAMPLVEDHAAFIYESPSSTPEHPKARVVFVLDSSITDPGICHLAYRALIWHFSNGAPDEAADEASKDPCRFFYGRPQAPHVPLGNIIYKDILQKLIEGYLQSGTGSDLSTPGDIYVVGSKVPTGGRGLRIGIGATEHSSVEKQVSLLQWAEDKVKPVLSNVEGLERWVGKDDDEVM